MKNIFNFSLSAFLVLFIALIPLGNSWAQQTTFRTNYDNDIIGLFNIPVASTEALTPQNYIISGMHATTSSLSEIDAIGNLVWGKSFAGYTFADLKSDNSQSQYIVCGGGISSSSSALLLILDANGNTVTARNFSISQADGAFFNRVIKASDGGYVAVGYVTGYDPDGSDPEVKFSPRTNNDPGCSESSTETISSPLIVKFDANGNHLWHRVFRYYIGSLSPANSIYNDGSFADVTEVSDGYIAVGNYHVNAVFSKFDSDDCDDTTPTDAMFLKTSTTGTITYHRQLDNPSSSTSQDSKSFASISTTSTGLPLISGTDNDGRPVLLMRLPGSGGWANPTWIRKFDGGNFFLAYHPFLPSKLFETSDGNYAFWANYIPFGIPPRLSNALVKINPSNNSAIFAKEYTFSLASILPFGEQVSDGGYIGVSYTLAGTGHNLHVMKVDANGDGPSDCPASDITIGSGSVSYTYGTPIYKSWNSNNVTNSSASPVGVAITPSPSIQCRTIVCNAPPVPTASASGNNICPGTAVTISATGSGSNVTYDVFTQASGGTSIGTAPQSVSPSVTTTYYVEAYENSDPLCVTARDSVKVTVLPPTPAQPGAISGKNPACPSTTEAYSVSTVSGASTYNWSISGGGNISGTGTSANVTWGTTPGTYTISVTAENSCGTSPVRTLQVTVGNPAPAQPAAISGTNNPCLGAQTYSIGSVAGATSYDWNISGGGTISGSGTSISVNWTSSGGPYTLSVTAVNACGNSAARTLQVNVKDAAPTNIGAISGDTPVCFGTENYSVSSVPRATNYAWSVNGGGTISSGQGSASININWTSAGTHTISVYAENDCGQTTTETLQVTVDSPAPAQPGTITGDIAPCPDTLSYSIASVSGADHYLWTLSGGGNIISGDSTTSVNIDWTTPGGPYTLSVIAENSCGNSAAQTLQINVGELAPTSIDSINGDNLVCPGTETYTIPRVTGASNYDWTLSGGGTITSGQGTNSININWTNAGNYTLTVKAENSCGSINSAPKNIKVLSGLPIAPSLIGPADVCPGTEAYSIVAVSGASGYSWTLSGGGNIIYGTISNSILVDWGTTTGTYTLSVSADNICGQSNKTDLQVTVTSGPPTGSPSISGDNPTCIGTSSYSLTGVSGASSYTWTLDAGGTIASGQGTDNISIDWASSGGPYTLEVFSENSCGYGDTNSISVFVDSLPEFNGDTIVGEINPCPGTENYSVATIANASTYNWTISAGGTITSGQGTNNISVNWTASGGPYTLSVSPSNDCGNGAALTQSINVQAGTPSAPSAISGESTVCQGSGAENYSVNAVTGATNYVWTLSGGGTITSGQGTTTIEVDWTGTPGNYEINVSAENNCGISASTSFTVNIIAGAPDQPAEVNGPIEICPGTENYSVASVANANIYTWTLSSGGNIVSGQGSENITVNWTTSGGPYTLNVFAENNCGSSAAQSLQVNVLASPTAPSISTSGDTICEGNNTVITASGSTGGSITYGIYDAQTGGNFLGNSPLEVSPENTTTYYVEAINDKGCSYAGGRVPVSIIVNAGPNSPSLEADSKSLCSGDSTNFRANASAGSSISWWSAETGGQLLGTGSDFNTGQLTESTTFYVSTTSANGCELISDRIAINANVLELPYLSLSSDANNNSIFINEALTAIAEPDYYDLYNFYLNGEEVQEDSIHTWAASIFENGDVVSVIATDAGCIGNEAKITITVNEYPNAFTPNGDGRNDIFLKGFDLVILNRWGQELYKGIDGWDGTFNGKKVAPGTYFYIIKVQDITEKEKVLKGSVLVNN